MFPETIKERLALPTGRIKLVIDTDAKNEVDDQYAIAWAIRSPERFEIEAIYAAPFSGTCMQTLFAGNASYTSRSAQSTIQEDPADGMRRSYDEVELLLSLLKAPYTDRLYQGSTQYLPADGSPVISDAAQDLVRRARASREPLYVAACGVLTNIASAILMAPDIINKMVVVWLGGQPIEFGHGIEYNLMQDVKATQVLLNSGVPFVMIPAMNVASLLSASAEELAYNLKGKNAIADYLYSIVVNQFTDIGTAIHFMKKDRLGYLRGREDSDEAYLGQFHTDYISWSRIIWDVSVIAFLKNPNWVPTKEIAAPILLDDYQWDTDETRHPIRIATYCWRNFIFGDLFHALSQDVPEICGE